MIQLFSNNFITTVSSTIFTGDTTINVVAGSGMNTPGTDEYEQVTLYNGTAYEIIKVTARAGNVLTATRAQEGTAAIECAVGDTVFSSISAGTISRLRTESMAVAVTNANSTLTVGTAQGIFRMPYAFTLSEVRASVTTAPTDVAIIVDINASGATILSTKLTIDVAEKTSTTAATAAVISGIEIADDTEITIDIDQTGVTQPGEGLVVYLIGQQA